MLGNNSVIHKISINGFRSINTESITCSEINVFSGTNDSGKSNILRALNLFFNRQTDFQANLKFMNDYSKISFARAVRSSKGKQQIKIRVYFNPPISYTSLVNEKEVYLERAFDRFGHMTEKYSDDSKKRSINRLFNSINYIYIPALKGRDVLQYILGLIGEYELIEQDDIETLNEKINNKTNDLNSILTDSKFTIGTTFGLPTLLTDFWEKLSVDTKYDNLVYLEENIRGKEGDRKLNPAQFKIPLTSRGEGIKSKFIPPLLLWLQKNNSRKIYIWGIDEPENSLEFGLAEELASLYYNDYASKVQILLTSHSLAFLNPAKGVNPPPSLFRCIKREDGATIVKSVDELRRDRGGYEIFSELGVLEVQNEIIDKYRGIIKEKTKMQEQLKKYKHLVNEFQMPIVLTEGKTDAMILETAWRKLYSNEAMPFKIEPVGVEPSREKRTGNADLVKRTLELVANLNEKTCMIGVFDNDTEGNTQFKGLSEISFEDFKIDSITRKHKTKNIYGLLLPVPNSRTLFVAKNDIQQRYFVIEHYFSNEILLKNNLKGENILNTEVFYISKNGNKNAFASEKVPKLDKADFIHFQCFFDEVKRLLGVSNTNSTTEILA